MALSGGRWTVCLQQTPLHNQMVKTANNIQAIYNGVQVPELNNHLSRLDY